MIVCWCLRNQRSGAMATAGPGVPMQSIGTGIGSDHARGGVFFLLHPEVAPRLALDAVELAGPLALGDLAIQLSGLVVPAGLLG